MMDGNCRILVTGATGNVGTETLLALAAHITTMPGSAVHIRAAVRDPGSYVPASAFVEAVRFDFLDRSSWKGAITDIDTVFLVRPPAIADIDATLGPFIALLAEKGIRKIVFLSLQGVEHMPYVPHYKVEERIKACGIPYVFLRPSFFMQNLSTTHRREIAQDNEIFVPAGRGRTNFIDVRDIGEVAAKVLLEAGHEGQAYELTGPDNLDYFQVAAILSGVLGKPIQYTKPSALRFILRSVRNGVSINFALIQAGIYLAAALGKAEHSADTFERLMGRKARDFGSFASDMKESWTR